MYEPPLEILARLEPWRFRSGYPSKVDDPLWNPAEHHFCGGEVDHEGEGSKHWICESCGFIGWGSYVEHYPVKSPEQFYRECSEHYRVSRLSGVETGKLTDLQAEHQKLHVMAIALKKAAETHPEKLDDLIRKISNL